MKPTLDISPTEIKNILSQFNPDIIRDSEQEYKLKTAIQNLDNADKIIFCLYSELASERQTAKILGLSRTPVHKILEEIKIKIKNELNKNETDN